MRGGPGVIVTGVLMTVDSLCSVAISSLSEGECPRLNPSPSELYLKPTTTEPEDTTPYNPSQSFTDSTAVIIGGAVAIVLVAITIITIAVLMVKNRRAIIKLVCPWLQLLSLAHSLCSSLSLCPLSLTHTHTLSLTLSLLSVQTYSTCLCHPYLLQLCL